VIDAFNAKKHPGTGDSAAAKKKAAEEEGAEKHAAAVHGASGKVENTVTDIIGAWNGYAAGDRRHDQADRRTASPKTGRQADPRRKLTPDDIRAAREGLHAADDPHRPPAAGRQAARPGEHRLPAQPRPEHPYPEGLAAAVPNGRGDPKPTSGQQNGLGGK
jgi:hypothetical protein